MSPTLIKNRSIRIFISSTFRDMQKERDYLMKMVFPYLKKVASDRDVTLTELDLRWGITEEEAQSGKVVDICLREIENSIPFFIGIIGDRYGWIPEEHDLDSTVSEHFPKVKNYLENRLSVTEMEMQFGVLDRDDDMHALFFIKDFHGGDTDIEVEKPSALKKLEELKAAVRKSRYQSFEYQSYEDLAEKVKDSFLRLMDELFPAEQLSAHQKARLVQHSFITRLSSAYVKDETNFKRLDDFASDDSQQYLVVTGESGLGKSSLLANWVRERENSADFVVIPYFSSNGGSQTYTRILRYLVDELSEKFGIEAPEADERKQLELIYESLAARRDKAIIVFDAINQIADVNKAKMLRWLPLPPPCIKYIFSTLQEDKTMDVFESRNYPIFVLKKLSSSQRRLLIKNFLGSYGKKLTAFQTEVIANSFLCQNTLVLKTLLEELITYGYYEKLDQRIGYYLDCEDVESFYEKVIERYEQDFSREFVSLVLGLIAVSRDGLSEDDILEMTGAKRYVFSDFFFAFSTHLNNQSGKYVFTHSYITNTVWKRYLTNDQEFETLCRRRIVSVVSREGYGRDEVPYQLDRLNDWKSLHDFITDIGYLHYKLSSDELEISTYWRHIFEGTGDLYSVRDYDEVFDGNDRIRFDADMIRLCGVVCLEKIKREYVVDLKNILDNHPEEGTAFLYNLLAGCFPEGTVGTDYAEKSIALYKKAGDIPGELSVYSTLSGLYYHKSVVFHETECEEAAKSVRLKLLELGREYYGEVCPVVMNAYQELCITNEDLVDGLEFGRKAVEIGIAVYGKNHPALGRPYHYVGCIYREMKNWEAALENFRMSCSAWTPAYGLHHEIMVSSYGNQCTCLINLGRFDEALECNSKCLQILKNTDDEDSHDAAVTHCRRGEIFLGMGDEDSARNEYLNAENILSRENIRNEARSIALAKRVKEIIETRF